MSWQRESSLIQPLRLPAVLVTAVSGAKRVGRPSRTRVGEPWQELEEAKHFYERVQLIEPCVFLKNRFGFLI